MSRQFHKFLTSAALLLAFISVSTLSIFAQNEQNIIDKLTKDKQGEGTIRIIQDPRITALVGKKGEGRSFETDGATNYIRSRGYRIQLYMGNTRDSKREAFEIEKKIKELFPTSKTYVIYEAPFWRVCEGNYKSWEEADQALRTLRSNSRSKALVKEALIRKDEIRIDL